MYINTAISNNTAQARLTEISTAILRQAGQAPLTGGSEMTTPNANQIKHNLRKQGHTLKSWSEAHGFKYRDVSEVIRGIRRGNYGTGRDIRLKLGLPVDEQLTA